MAFQKVGFIRWQALAIKLGKRNRLWLNIRAARRSIDLVEFIAIVRTLEGDPVRLFREFVAGKTRPNQRARIPLTCS
jgi:hypothetical protein